MTALADLRRSRPWRWALWVAVLALLLRAAVPMLAAGAAQARGLAVGSVCTVYGVVLPGAAPDVHRGGHHRGGTAGGDADAADTGEHCALTALTALAGLAAAPAAGAAPVHGRTAAAPAMALFAAWADATAAWVAQRKQGPPARR